jgi:mRNA interferase MazF
MAQYVKGDLVLTPFPFSDDEGFKVRPALVLAVLPYGSGMDYLVCIITTQPAPDPHLLPLTNADIDGGRLSQSCFLRPGYVYTVGQASIKRRLGTLKSAKLEQVTRILVSVLTA